MKLLIPLVLVIAFFILFIKSEQKIKNTIETFNTEDNGPTPSDDTGPSPSPETEDDSLSPSPETEDDSLSPSTEREDDSPSPSTEREDDSPSPSPEKADESQSLSTEITPSPSSNEEGKTDTQLNTPELRNKLKNIIENILGAQEKLIFKQNEDNYSIKLEELQFSKITNHQKNIIEKKIKEHFDAHLKAIFKRTKNKDFDIDIKRINVIIVPGSTLIIIGITPKKISDMYISKENKELLEFYNFMNILNYGNLPISERQYINTNMFDILS